MLNIEVVARGQWIRRRERSGHEVSLVTVVSVGSVSSLATLCDIPYESVSITSSVRAERAYKGE